MKLEKKNNLLVDLQLKDLDQKAGIVAFYFAPFGVYDAHNDIHEEKAFDRTFRENKDRVIHLRNHNDEESPGVITELGKDKKGAFAVSKLALKTIVGKDTFEQYEAKIIRQHSYGADPKMSKFKPDGKGGRILLDRDLYEVSSLTHWAASDKTPVISIKSLGEAESRMNDISKVLRNGNISDKSMLKLLKEYKHLKKILKKKDELMEAMDMVRCGNCKTELIRSAMQRDPAGKMICDNCQYHLEDDGTVCDDNDSDDTEVSAEDKSLRVKKILDSISLPEEKSRVAAILESMNLEMKKDFSQGERDKAAKEGAALPDGSFPIYNSKDLSNAIADVGRASDPAAAKAHIKKRAEALGLTKSLPADWK